jgi:salicylate hydroxylase
LSNRIEDAAVLSNLLQANRDSLENAGSILAEYSRAREQRARDVVRFSFRFILLHGAVLPYGIGVFLRWFVYALMPASTWLWYLTWLYGYQPTVAALAPKES